MVHLALKWTRNFIALKRAFGFHADDRQIIFYSWASDFWNFQRRISGSIILQFAGDKNGSVESDIKFQLAENFNIELNGHFSSRAGNGISGIRLKRLTVTKALNGYLNYPLA